LNGVPIPFAPSEGLRITEDRKDLVTRIEHAGIAVLDMSLYDVSLAL
jgi:hypothetical protein